MVFETREREIEMQPLDLGKSLLSSSDEGDIEMQPQYFNQEQPNKLHAAELIGLELLISGFQPKFKALRNLQPDRLVSLFSGGRIFRLWRVVQHLSGSKLGSLWWVVRFFKSVRSQCFSALLGRRAVLDQPCCCKEAFFSAVKFPSSRYNRWISQIFLQSLDSQDFFAAITVRFLSGLSVEFPIQPSRDCDWIGANSASKEKAQAHVRELEEEVKLLQNLSHPNIVRYLGTAREDEMLNILLEFVPGGSISSLLGKFNAFPESALIVATLVCTSVFVVFTHYPSASSTKFLPWVFALLVALFPVTYLLDGQLRARSIFGDGIVGEAVEEDNKLVTLLAIEGSRTSLLGLYAAIFMLIALEIKFELASFMQEKFADRGPTPNRSGRSNSVSFPPKMRFMQQRLVSIVPTFTTKRLAAECAWMPFIGNVATVTCFIICLILNVSLTGGSNRAIFLLAPILLLLNQDSDFVSGLKERQRYFPVTMVISVYLVLTAIYRIWEEVWHGNAGWGMEIGGPDWFYAVKNLALLILTFPSHILFNCFVWSQTKQTISESLLTLPLNLSPVIITDVIKVKILGLLGMIYSLAQYLISRQQHISGLKYI